MANGNGKAQALQDTLDKVGAGAARFGWLGVAGMSFFVLQAMVVLIAHPSLDNLASVLGSVGWVLTSAGILQGMKRLQRMTANNGADAAIGRAAISAQLPGPDLPVVASDPVTHRELEKRLTPPAAGAAVKGT